MDAESRTALGNLDDNDLASGTMAVVERIRPHLGGILLGVLVLFAALAVWTLVSGRQRAERAAAWEECLDAMAAGDAGRLADVANRYSGSAAGQWAELVQADALLAEGNRLLLSDAEAGRRMLREAVGRYTAVNAQRPEALAAQRGILGLARARESLGELAEAGRGYQALVAEYPDGPFRPLAEERITALARESTAEWYKWFESRPAAAPADASAPAEPESAIDDPSEPSQPVEPAEPAAG